MVYRRIELTPAEQLKGLCETRDRYAALADSLRENSAPLLDPDMRLAKEHDARRIAHAYEKSIANSMVRMSSLGQTHQIRLPSLSARTWLAFFMAISVLEGGLLLAYFRPAIFQNRPAAPRLAVHRVERIAFLPPVTRAPPPIAVAPKPAAKPQAPPPVSVAPKPSAQPQLPPSIVVAPGPAAQPQSPPPIAIPPQPAAQPQAPPPVATAPQPATPPPIATFVVPAAPPQATASAPPQAAQPVQPLTRLEPVTQTHSLPPYPLIARSLGEEGTTRMRVAISVQGAVTDCEIVRTSGSARLDGEACNYVQGHWRWNPPTRNGQPVTATTEVSMVWSLKTRQ